MPRKGIPKVRTGCLTCKKRRVKCDEARPSCERCTTTGRKCDGYTRTPPGSYSWDFLLAARTPPIISPYATVADGRAMAYFREVVANVLPCVPCALDISFWNSIVLQRAQNEPAVTHAIIAISSLYELMSETQSPQRHPLDNAFAIRHYNAAIRRILSLSASCLLDNILLLCALFICIELLRGDAKAAVGHCRQGIGLMNSMQGNSGVASIIYRLNALPLFFENMSTSFHVAQQSAFLINVPFKMLKQAQASISWLAARALRLGRAGEKHRLALGYNSQLSPLFILEQEELIEGLRKWSLAFLALQQADNPLTMALLEMRGLVWKIYAATCLDKDETIYDAHVASFQRIIDISAHVQFNVRLRLAAKPRFGFETDYYSSLYFVVVNCRQLQLRLRALLMLKSLSQPREMMWHAATLYAVGKSIIEIEHGIELTAKIIETVDTNIADTTMPLDNQRVRGVMIGSTVRLHLDNTGTQMQQIKVQFVLPDIERGGTLIWTRDITLE